MLVALVVSVALPDTTALVTLKNKKAILDPLYHASAETLLEVARDLRQSGHGDRLLQRPANLSGSVSTGARPRFSDRFHFHSNRVEL